MSIISNSVVSNIVNNNTENENITTINSTHSVLNAKGVVHANNKNLNCKDITIYNGDNSKIHADNLNTIKILHKNYVDVVNIAIHNTIDKRCYYALGLKRYRSVSLLYCPTIYIDNGKNGKINEDIKIYVNGTFVNVIHLSGIGQQSSSIQASQAWGVAAYTGSYICFHSVNHANFSNDCKYTIHHFTYS